MSTFVRACVAIVVVCGINAPLFAPPQPPPPPPTVYISGNYSGSHTYIGQNVVTNGALNLTGPATIKVYGGSITIAHAVKCIRATGGSLDGAAGDDGVPGGASALQGYPGLAAYDFTLETIAYQGTTGSISIGGSVNLSGGKGGKGGKGADAYCADPLSNGKAENGRAGGDAGGGGSFKAMSCSGLTVSASISTSGGIGGDGGSGGAPDPLVPGAHVGADGGIGGNGGSGGLIVLSSALNGQLYVGPSVTLNSSGGNAGAGGTGGGHEPRTGCVGGAGGNGGLASNGGKITLTGLNVFTNGPTFQASGGNGGSGGNAGKSAEMLPVFPCSGGGGLFCPGGGRGGKGGNSAMGGIGGDIEVYLLQPSQQSISGYWYTHGGSGGNGGRCEFSVLLFPSTCVPWPDQNQDGADGWPGGLGGTGGKILVSSPDGVLTVSGFWSTNGGCGGSGGRGGEATCLTINNGLKKVCGKGGAGGSGANGGLAGPMVITVGDGSADVSSLGVRGDGGCGGNGGDAGYCRASPGPAGLAATDTSLTVFGTKIGTESVVSSNHPDGLPGQMLECPEFDLEE